MDASGSSWLRFSNSFVLLPACGSSVTSRTKRHDSAAHPFLAFCWRSCKRRRRKKWLVIRLWNPLETRGQSRFFTNLLRARTFRSSSPGSSTGVSAINAE